MTLRPPLKWAWLVVIPACLGVGLAVALITSGGRSHHEPAPPVSGLTSAGRHFSLATTRGHWVLVNFFASWCPGCRAEMPYLAQLARERPHHLQIVSVDTDDSMGLALQLVRRQGGSWTVVSDSDAVAAWGVEGLPESFLVDPDGRVFKRVAGPLTAKGLGHF